MIELRILYLVLAGAIGAVAVFLCILLFHLIKVIRDTREITERLSLRAKLLDDVLEKLIKLIESITKMGEEVKEKGTKFTESISGIVGMAGAIKKIIQEFKKEKKVEKE